MEGTVLHLRDMKKMQTDMRSLYLTKYLSSDRARLESYSPVRMHDLLHSDRSRVQVEMAQVLVAHPFLRAN